MPDGEAEMSLRPGGGAPHCGRSGVECRFFLQKSRNEKTALAENLSDMVKTHNERFKMDPEKKERLKIIRERAKQMRKNPTPSEAAFWQLVRGRRFRGHRFRRQVVLYPYIVDFCCHSLQLVVEIDGPVHALRRGSDRHRSADLSRRGFKVFRFGAAEVLDSPGKVWKVLVAWHDARDE